MSAAILALSPEHTLELGKTLGLVAKPGDVILLTGELGAGKTQFTKGVALSLGVEQPVTSPTFNLVCEYQDAECSQNVLRHFDLYRLDREEELEDIDYFGLLEDEVVSVVEWGDKFPEALPRDYLLVEFEYVNESTRALRYWAMGSNSAALMDLFEEAAMGSGLVASGGMSGGAPAEVSDVAPSEVSVGAPGGAPGGASSEAPGGAPGGASSEAPGGVNDES